MPFYSFGWFGSLGAPDLIGCMVLSNGYTRFLNTIIYIYFGKPKSGAPQFFSYCMAFTDKLININARTLTSKDICIVIIVVFFFNVLLQSHPRPPFNQVQTAYIFEISSA